VGVTQPYPPKGKRVKKKLRGGPWASEEHNFTVLEDGSTIPAEIKIHGRDGSYVGRYVLRDKVQKNGTLKIMEWETPEQYARALRVGIMRGVWPV